MYIHFYQRSVYKLLGYIFHYIQSFYNTYLKPQYLYILGLKK